MFKHILLPTDGSKVSEAAIEKGVRLAKSINAKVTGISVIPEFHVFTYRTEMLEDTREQFLKDSKLIADRYLDVVKKAADAADVACDTLYVVNDHPYEAIVMTAEEKKCDLIAMASHGRKGIQSLFVGSETQKVLVHSKIPVLVLR